MRAHAAHAPAAAGGAGPFQREIALRSLLIFTHMCRLGRTIRMAARGVLASSAQ
jgi:hypothetical protein